MDLFDILIYYEHVALASALSIYIFKFFKVVSKNE